MTDEEYVKPSDVAKRLGVTRGAVYKWIREGKLRSVRFGDNAVRIPRSALEEFERRAAIEGGEYNTSDALSPDLAPALAPG
jgi:excisionase family DNA binding protein